MPFVSRDEEGHIDAVFKQTSPNASEQLNPTDPELLNFLSDEKNADTATSQENLLNLRLSDLGMIRVLDDLIEILFEKEILALSDLPKAAVERLKKRRVLRDRLQPYAHQLDPKNKDVNVLNPQTWLDDD